MHNDTTTVSLTPVLVTAAFALITLVLVQGFVVPWAQARNRARERWEDAVTELSSLTHLTLPRLMNEYRSVTRSERYLRQLEGDDKFDQEKLDQLLKTDSQRRRDLDDEIGDAMTRMNVLTGRVVTVRKKARASVELHLALRLLTLATQIVVSPAPLDESESDRDASWEKHLNTRTRFAKELRPFEERMKPPPLEPDKWIKAKFNLFLWNVAAPKLRSLRRLRRRGNDQPTGDSATTSHQ